MKKYSFILFAFVFLAIVGKEQTSGVVFATGDSTPCVFRNDSIIFTFSPSLFSTARNSATGKIASLNSIRVSSVMLKVIDDVGERQLSLRKNSNSWTLILPATDFAKRNLVEYSYIINGNFIVQNPEASLAGGKDKFAFTVPSFKRKTTFSLAGFAKAKKVILAGDFNGWSEHEYVMRREGNSWKYDTYLKPGRYFYKYIVDGEWQLDPSNQHTAHDWSGNINSVLIIPSVIGDVEFSLRGYSQAREVALSGSFNAWSEGQHFFEKRDSLWKCRLSLRPGKHVYKFIVDGKWINDPANKLTEPNEFDSFNSVVVIPSTVGNVVFTLEGYKNAKEVAVAGSFNSWSTNRHLLQFNGKNWQCKVQLKPGTYLYKFVVDGNWILDPSNKEVVPNEFNTGNSVLRVK